MYGMSWVLRLWHFIKLSVHMHSIYAVETTWQRLDNVISVIIAPFWVRDSELQFHWSLHTIAANFFVLYIQLGSLQALDMQSYGAELRAVWISPSCQDAVEEASCSYLYSLLFWTCYLCCGKKQWWQNTATRVVTCWLFFLHSCIQVCVKLCVPYITFI